MAEKRSLSEDPPAEDQPEWTDEDDLGPLPQKKPRMATSEEVAAQLAEARAVNKAAKAATANTAVINRTVMELPSGFVFRTHRYDKDRVPVPPAFHLSMGETELAKDEATATKALVTFNDTYIDEAFAAATPVHVAILVDVSYSMEGCGITAAAETIRQVPKQLLDDTKLKFEVSLNTFHGIAQSWDPENCDIKAADLEGRCNEFADALQIPEDSYGTNHQDAIKSAFEYLKLKRGGLGLKHIVLVTDGDATVGQCNPLRLQLEMREMLKELGDEQIVVHMVVVGSHVNREVPKNICAPTAGVVAFALRAETLPDEMAKVFAPIKEAPQAIVLQIGWGGGIENNYVRHGLLTKNHKHVVVDLNFDPSREKGRQARLGIRGHNFEHTKLFDLKPKAELAPVVVPADLKFELEALEIQAKMVAEAEEALRTRGAQAMAHVTKTYTDSAPVVALPQYLRDRFNRRARTTATYASLQIDVPDEPVSPMADQIGTLDPNAASMRMASMMSQSNY